MSVSPRQRDGRRSARRHHDLTAIRKKRDLIAALLSLPYLDPDQSAIIAQTSASTIRRACANGCLPHVRVNGGKLIRIAPAALRAWLTADSGLPQAS